jgi:hypothetical protein
MSPWTREYVPGAIWYTRGGWKTVWKIVRESETRWLLYRARPPITPHLLIGVFPLMKRAKEEADRLEQTERAP